MVSLSGTIGKLESKHIVIVGDLLLDSYTIGQTRRISPEAPVVVVNVTHQEERPGGAGNVVLNLLSLGATVSVVGRVGYDSGGETLINALNSEGVNTKGIVRQPGFQTPHKNRIIAGGQQIVRVDHEHVSDISEQIEDEIIANLPSLLQNADLVAVSDYGKGSVTPTLLAAVIAEAKSRGIPVIADPKGTDFIRYNGATILKPNLGEAYAAAGFERSVPLEKVAEELLKKISVEVLMITRSEDGISLYFKDGRHENYPVEAMEIRDVTGAGDTVLAVLAFALANGLDYGNATQLANVAAGIAISHFGCARVSLSMVAKKLLEKDTVNKVFEQEHLFALQQSLIGRRLSILGITLSDGLTEAHFLAIQKMADQSGRDLLVYVKDPSPSTTLLKVLASLNEINYIVICGKNLRALCEKLIPEEVVVLENGICQTVDAVHSLVAG